MKLRLTFLLTLLSSGCPEPAFGPFDTDPEVPDDATKAAVYAVETEWIDVDSWQDIHVAASCDSAADIAISGGCEYVELLGDEVGCAGLGLVGGGVRDGDGSALDEPAGQHCFWRVEEVGVCRVRATVNCIGS